MNPDFTEEVFVFPASFAQQRLWFLDRLLPENPLYNVPTALRLSGVLDLAALERTFNEIVRRHEVLRTTFKTIEGKLVQIISPSLKICLPVLNLRELPAEKREAEAMRLLERECDRPFNLSDDCLLKVLVLQLDSTEHILLLNLHHIVCDDWSIGILIREIKILYTAFTQKQPSPLPELPLQYADFAEWQREWLQGEVLETQLAYWRQYLRGVSTLNLPSDRPKSAIQNHRGETVFLELTETLTDELEMLCQQEGVTLFMALLAAFQTLLYRYTHQEDITVGSPIANRNRSEIEGIIGFFVNSLVLRTDFSGKPSFREVLNRVKEVTLGAYAHQDLPFEKLVEELHPERNLSYHPLFQVMFSFQNAPMQDLELPGLKVRTVNIEIKTTRFDLEFNLWQCGEGFRSLWGGDRWKYTKGIRGIIVYNRDLFDQSTITRMVGHFQTLLEGIVKNPEQRVAELPMLTESERHQLLTEWNNTETIYPKNLCIHQLFAAQVEQTPDAIALISGCDRLTYRELNQRSNHLANYLKKLGVDREILVGICAESSIEMIVGMLGIIKAGGAYVPLDPNYPLERLNFMLNDAQVTVLLTQEKYTESFPEFSKPIVYLDKDWKNIYKESEETPNNSVTSDNLAYVISTSGSTGKPKGVAVPHKAVNRLVCNTNYIKLEPSDKIAQVSNISFDAATFEIWGALLNGAQLIVINREVVLSPQEFALEIQEKNITVLFLTTALFQQMARIVPQAYAGLRYLLFGGETVDTRWVKKIIQKGAPKQLLHVYGPTENTTFSSYYRVEELPESATSIPIGRPISNTQIYLLDEKLQPVAIGIVGELYIGGDGLARGYLNRSDLTAERFIPHPFSQMGCRGEWESAAWETGGAGGEEEQGKNSQSPVTKLYKTGDLGRYLPDGNIEFLGRIDNQVKIRGFRIELGEIEAVLHQHPQVDQAVIIVTEEVPGEKHLIAYIVANKNQPLTTTNLRQFLKEKLPEFMVPSAYVLLESLPLTPNGKVDRKALPSIDTLSLDITENYLAPRNNIEQILVEIFAQILGREQVGVLDNFFELGGHSLLATQLTSRIRDVFHIELPVRNLFEAPTVASLAKYIETLCWAKSSHTNIADKNQREEVEF